MKQELLQRSSIFNWKRLLFGLQRNYFHLSKYFPNYIYIRLDYLGLIYCSFILNLHAFRLLNFISFMKNYVFLLSFHLAQTKDYSPLYNLAPCRFLLRFSCFFPYKSSFININWRKIWHYFIFEESWIKFNSSLNNGTV